MKPSTASAVIIRGFANKKQIFEDKINLTDLCSKMDDDAKVLEKISGIAESHFRQLMIFEYFMIEFELEGDSKERQVFRFGNDPELRDNQQE